MRFSLWYSISKMGGLCSKNAQLGNVPSAGGNNSSHRTGLRFEPTTKTKSRLNPQFSGQDGNKKITVAFSNSELGSNSDGINATIAGMNVDEVDNGIPQLCMDLSQDSKPTKSKHVAKVSEMSSLLGKAGGKAVDVLDTLGSGMTSLHHSSGFVSGVPTKENKISILAFEVANTIVKGANLMQSLSEENISHLKKVVLRSEAVQSLISKDIDELQRIAAADKREELKVFSGEVVRFGNRCKDHQYHNLDRYFEKLASELSPQNQLKDEVETVMQHLMALVQYTAELYHELHSLDRIEQDYRLKLQEEDKVCATQRGDSLAILRAELKSQRKQVKSLKKKSLWSKILEEVMEKLVDIVHFLHLEIHEAFGSVDDNRCVRITPSNNRRLGPAGLALHYANIITQIDTLVSRSSSIPPNMRDSLYQGLPPTVKLALRNKLQTIQLNEELTITQIKVEMEKTLLWLVPIAANTTKAHHGFGWVGEWANTSSELNGKPAVQDDLLRIETLYHADKGKVDNLILDLVAWLHQLIIQSRATVNSETQSPIKSPFTNQKTVHLLAPMTIIPSSTTALSVEDQQMLRDVTKRKVTPGISKSQEFDTSKRQLGKHHRLSKSSNHSPTRDSKREVFSTRRPSSVPIINFDTDPSKALDVIDDVHRLYPVSLS